MMHRPLLVAAALTLVAACDDQSGPLPAAPAGYPYAYSTNSCGPTDGPATMLLFVADSSPGLPREAPRLQVAIYRGAADLQGEEIRWPAMSPDAWAGRCSGGSECEEATSAVLELRDNAADTVLSGTVLLRFRDGTSVRGGFEATWRRTQELCG